MKKKIIIAIIILLLLSSIVLAFRNDFNNYDSNICKTNSSIEDWSYDNETGGWLISSLLTVIPTISSSDLPRSSWTLNHTFHSSLSYACSSVGVQLNVASMDVFSRLMMDRIIFLGLPVDDYVANVIQAQLLYLDSADASKDIQVYINSPGGSVYAGLGIYDTMQYTSCDVATICTGMAASMAAVLLTAGEKGKRSALKHSRILIHQPMSGAQGQASDMEIAVKEVLKVKEN